MRFSQKWNFQVASPLHKVFVTCFPEKVERGILKEIALMLFISHHLQSYADLQLKV